MQIRGQFQDFFYETALPALNAKVIQGFKAKPPVFKKILNTMTTARSIEQFSQVTGVGLPQLVGEAEDISVDSMVQGFNKTFRPLKYALGIACSQELVEDDKMGIVASRATALANAVSQLREIQGASVLNNAFDGTNFAGPDSKALCASDHPLVKSGGTQTNLLSVAADLDVTSLELALTDWELTKTAEGYYQMLSTPRLVCAAQNRWNVAEILKSQMRSDTANNTANAFKYTETGGTIESQTWAFLTDPDAWFLVAPPSETNMLWLDRKAPSTNSDFIQKNQTGYLYISYRAIVGFYGWAGVYGTPGA